MTKTPRVYGMADEDNRQTPAPENFRGERGATVDDPALRHDVGTGDGEVTVQEGSVRPTWHRFCVDDIDGRCPASLVRSRPAPSVGSTPHPW
jgi:hypothetical protein